MPQRQCASCGNRTTSVKPRRIGEEECDVCVRCYREIVRDLKEQAELDAMWDAVDDHHTSLAKGETNGNSEGDDF